MFARQALASFLNLFVVFIFFGVGLFLVGLPHLAKARIALIDLLTNRIEECAWMGVWFLVASMLLLLGFYAVHRGRYLVFRGSKNVDRGSLRADVRVIHQTVEDLFAKEFSKKIFLKEIEISLKSSLELKVKLAPTDPSSRKELFDQVERALTLLFKEQFDYVKPFHLIVAI